MLEMPNRDRVTERREATRREIVDAAWQLAREKGLVEVTLRDVAARVGMRAPSLYSHFDSKNAIYDAMFGQAWSEYEVLALAAEEALPADPRAAIKVISRLFFDFATADLARHQLMDQRIIPGFEPSPESYAPSVRVLEHASAVLSGLGVTSGDDIAIWVALLAGLVNQHHANDPGGTRYAALLDRAVDMWADAVGLPPKPPSSERTHPMTTTAPPATSATPRQPVFDQAQALRLAATEFDRVAAALAELDEIDWTRPTDCSEWDVRAMACHVVGMAEMTTGPEELTRQFQAAKLVQTVRGGPTVDSLTQVQVDERADWTPAQIVAAAATVGPRAVQGRSQLAQAIGHLPRSEPVVVNEVSEVWTNAYLLLVILTRDPWMHRMDLAQATGREPTLSADHDGVIVNDVVHEWASRHQRPYRLELTGPAGGTWFAGPTDQAESISMDAVEFCRTLSGRALGVGLTTTHVPF